MVSPGPKIVASPRVAGRFADWVPLFVALGLTCATGFLAAFLHWSLQRPNDWSARWAMEDEVTEDQSLHHARLAHGARFAQGKIGRGIHLVEKESLAVLDGWVAPHHWTIELWSKAFNPTPATQLIAGPTSVPGVFGVGISNGMFATVYSDPQGYPAWLSSGIRPSTNRWYHLAATSDGHVARIYVDGLLRATAPADKSPREFRGHGINLGGAYLDIHDFLIVTNSFQGAVDNLHLYPRALSESEVGALYRSTNSDPAARQWAIDVLSPMASTFLIIALILSLVGLIRPAFVRVPDLPTFTTSYRLVIAVIFVGFSLTGFFFIVTQRDAKSSDERRFHQFVTDFLERFDTRTESFVQNLTSLRSWLGGENLLTQEKWKQMIDSMQLWNDCPGLFSVGFAPAVDKSQLSVFETWARSMLGTNFQVHGRSSNPPPMASLGLNSSRNTKVFPVTFHSHIYRVEDQVVRSTDWGKDLMDTGRSLYEICQSAIKGPGIGACPPEELYPQGKSRNAVNGTRVFLGVFTSQTNFISVGQPVASAPGQRRNLGILFGSFDWQQFLDSMLGVQKAEIRFTLFTPQGNGKRFILAEHGPRPVSEQSSSQVLRTIYQNRFYSRRLHFEFETLPAFAQHSDRRWPFVIGGVGIALSLGVAGLVFIQVRARLKEAAASHELRQSRDQLQHLLRDRERISRDLHDGVIQSIYGIGLGLKHSRKLMERDPNQALTQLNESLSELDGTISDLRQFILNLEPDLPGGESLIAALEALVNRTRRITETEIQMHVDEGIDTTLSTHLSVHLMNLIREGLSNSVRHASATRIRISLQQDHARLRLQIIDNGKGFDTQSPSPGSGLRNIRARVKEIGGSLAVNSTPEAGTTLLVILLRDPAGGTAPPAHA